MGGVRPYTGQGGPQAPEVCICGTVEVAPTGVGICAAGHSGDRRCIWPSGGLDQVTAHKISVQRPQ